MEQEIGNKRKIQADNPPARAKIVSEISDAKGLKMTLKVPVSCVSVMLIAVATVMSLSASAETATLRVSIEGGAFNSKFKFYDASAGCPSYKDIPGAKDYLGGVFASNKGANKNLAEGQPVHVFLSDPRIPPAFQQVEGRAKSADARCRWC